MVGEGYVVDENNPVYVSTEDGMLLNKNRTEIRALPYKVEEISAPNTVRRMDIPANKMPEKDSSGGRNQKNCRISIIHT